MRPKFLRPEKLANGNKWYSRIFPGQVVFFGNPISDRNHPPKVCQFYDMKSINKFLVFFNLKKIPPPKQGGILGHNPSQLARGETIGVLWVTDIVGKNVAQVTNQRQIFEKAKILSLFALTVVIFEVIFFVAIHSKIWTVNLLRMHFLLKCKWIQIVECFRRSKLFTILNPRFLDQMGRLDRGGKSIRELGSERSETKQNAN